MFDKKELELLKIVIDKVQVQGVDNARIVVSIADKLEESLKKGDAECGEE